MAYGYACPVPVDASGRIILPETCVPPCIDQFLAHSYGSHLRSLQSNFMMMHNIHQELIQQSPQIGNISQPPLNMNQWHETHNIERTDQGTRLEKNAGNRRVRGDCRFCPCRSNGKRFSRVTTYRCGECDVFLHPECFMAYHRHKFK